MPVDFKKLQFFALLIILVKLLLIDFKQFHYSFPILEKNVNIEGVFATERRGGIFLRHPTLRFPLFSTPESALFLLAPFTDTNFSLRSSSGCFVTPG